MNSAKEQSPAQRLLSLYASGERDFAGVDLSGEKLQNANLHSARLPDAKLAQADLAYARLGGANLVGADLRQADLRWANLVGANLAYARLDGANLAGANLSDSYLMNANLSGANLSHSRLCGTHLGGADLRGATLKEAHLRGVLLEETNVGGAILGETELLGIDLAPLVDASPAVVHRGPSHVDYVSISLSIRLPGLKQFLQRTGMPETFVDYNVDCALSLDTVVFSVFRSTFISYGSPDEELARRLYEALFRNGVTTFFFPEHATPGDKLHRAVKRGINERDRVILICSRTSLDRPGVLFELEEALTREARMQGESLLIPIRLDDYVFKDWAPKNPDVAQAVRDRVVADFTGADQDEDKFQAGILRLLTALRK